MVALPTQGRIQHLASPRDRPCWDRRKLQVLAGELPSAGEEEGELRLLNFFPPFLCFHFFGPHLKIKAQLKLVSPLVINPHNKTNLTQFN